MAKVAEAGVEDVNLAVEAARQAYEGPWSQMTAAERGKFLFRIARMIQERSRELAIVESLDGGKPIRESRDVDIPLAAAHFFYYAGWADKLDYAFPGRQAQSIGVAAQILPWNFPFIVMSERLPFILAAGCSVVAKPSEYASGTCLILGEILHEAGIPAGVYNVITGEGKTVGKYLVENNNISLA